MPTALLWFRRDLRLTDHPALLAAVDAAGQDGDVVGVFVVDPRLWEPAGEPRRAFLLDCLDELRTAPGGVPAGYPGPIVDHAAERQIALDRYERVRGAGA